MKTFKKFLTFMLVGTAASIASLLIMGQRDGASSLITIYWVMVFIKLVMDEMEGAR